MALQSYLASLRNQHGKPRHQNLADQIIGRFATSKFDPEKRQFLPEGCLQELLTSETIIKELQDDLLASQCVDPPDDLIEMLVDFILQKAKKVFATTVLSGLRVGRLTHSMFEFMDLEFTDDCLPVTYGKMETIFSKGTRWSPFTIHNFYREQWRFLAPVFSKKSFKVNLEPDHILPFIEKNNFGKEGAFGQVFQVQVHLAHQMDQVPNVSAIFIHCV
jgi:hypothetical protein